MTTSTRNGSRKRNPATTKPPGPVGHPRRARPKPERESVMVLPEDSYEDALPGSLFLEGEPVEEDEAEAAADDWPARDSEEEDVIAEPAEVSRRGRH